METKTAMGTIHIVFLAANVKAHPSLAIWPLSRPRGFSPVLMVSGFAPTVCLALSCMLPVNMATTAT